MLSVKRLRANSPSYFLDLAGHDEYYSKGGEPPGTYLGKGCEFLDLFGTVDPQVLRNLYAGKWPDGRGSMVQIQHHEGRPDHRAGWDFTFNCDKSVSTIASQCDPETFRKIQLAQDLAVRAALDYIEETAIYTRRGSGGYSFERSRMIVVCFEHLTSRSGDPHYHSHALVMNAGIRRDGTIGTLSVPHLFARNVKMAAGAIYRAELAYQLELLGIEVERKGNLFEAKGVSKRLIDHFSKRRQEIEQELFRTGQHGPVAAAAAAIKTRVRKEDIVRERLFEEWKVIGESYGWSTQHAKKLFGRFIERRSEADEIGWAIASACSKLTKDNAHFSERDFVRALAEEAPGRGLNARTVLAIADKQLRQSPEFIKLGIYRGLERFTTREMYEMEQEALTSTEALVSLPSQDVRADTFVRVTSKHGHLSEEQLKALWHLTMESGSLSMVSGYAGSGKTTLLTAANEIWESEGIPVIGCAVAGTAQQELAKDSGIRSTTLAKILYDAKKGGQPVPRNSIVVLDEAGMVGTRDWLHLTEICKRAGAKLCAIGHEKQLQPIPAGAPFFEFGMRFGRAVMVRNQRQKEIWAQKAVNEIADGKADAALQAYIERGLVKDFETKSEAVWALIAQWRDDGMDTKDSLLLAGMHHEVDALNRIAQQEMRLAGRLSADSFALTETTSLHVGDTVMFKKRSVPRGIENGDRGMITKLDTRLGLVTVEMFKGDRVTVCTRDFPHLDLAYSMTVHKAQGGTTSRSYLLAGGAMQCREYSYVQVSRAKIASKFFVCPADDMDSMESLAKQMKQSRQKDMAISVERENAVQRQPIEHTL